MNTWEKIIFQSATQALRRKNPSIPNKRRPYNLLITPFAVHSEKIRNDLRETATNSAKIHSLARKYEHWGINQIQLRFLHFNQHSITLLDIHMRHWAYKREKCTSINANIKVINITLKVNFLCADVRIFALMNLSSHYWSPFHANDWVFSLI